MERRKFTREFKLEAVRLIKERGVSYSQASHDLGVHQSQLRGWVKALSGDPQHAFPGHCGGSAESATLHRGLGVAARPILRVYHGTKDSGCKPARWITGPLISM
jgi:transposase